MVNIDLITLDDDYLKRHSLNTIRTEKCRNSVPTCFLPSQHASKDARTLAQVGICFSQLGEGKRKILSF